MNLNCIFKKPIPENLGIDINFIRIGPANLQLYLLLCCSSMRMPSSGRNTKALLNQKLLDQYS